jgi:hypothetical protein
MVTDAVQCRKQEYGKEAYQQNIPDCTFLKDGKDNDDDNEP